MAIQICPSILSADFTRLGDEVRDLEAAGADRVHLDVMDGHFVPNITFGADLIRGLRGCTALPFDVHLMINPVDRLIDSFMDAGADSISFHPESGPHIHRTLSHIRGRGKKSGIALNPGTDPGFLTYLLNDVDFVVVMTVNPGFGGQIFLKDQVSKITAVRDLIGDRPIDIHVDGGITALTAPMAAAAGATHLISGSAILKSPDYAASIQELRCA